MVNRISSENQTYRPLLKAKEVKSRRIYRENKIRESLPRDRKLLKIPVKCVWMGLKKVAVTPTACSSLLNMRWVRSLRHKKCHIKYTTTKAMDVVVKKENFVPVNIVPFLTNFRISQYFSVSYKSSNKKMCNNHALCTVCYQLLVIPAKKMLM